MRKIQLIIAMVLLTASLNRLSAQDYKFGIGLRLSTSTPSISSSVSGKFFLNDRAAIEGLVSFNPGFGIGGLFEMHQLIGGIQSLNWFYGGGGYFGVRSNIVYAGPMGIVGIDYKFDNAPINVSLDWKPELDIAPAINFIPDAFALSVRFTLK
ncbi:MAG: hypothetical protein JST75_19865 [Bacteroidetes bacterium]|nr:hypothetical protein [Bacteroidota bacterium]